MQIAGLVHPELDFAGFHLFYRLGHIHGHGSGLGIGHQASWAQYPAKLADLPHQVRGRDDDVHIEPAVLDLLDVFRSYEIGARGFGFLRLLALSQHQDPDFLAYAVRQHHRPANDLIGVPRVDSQVQGDIHALIELGEGGPPHFRHGFPWRIVQRTIDGRRGAVVFLPGLRHQPSTSIPIERAVPAIILIADSRSAAFRSGILSSAIFLTWARVTLPTLVRFG